MIRQAISYSVRPCPVCGRPLEILPEHHGKRVTCQHCRGQFVSDDSPEAGDEFEQKVERTLARAGRFIANSSQRPRHPEKQACFPQFPRIHPPTSGPPRDRPRYMARGGKRQRQPKPRPQRKVPPTQGKAPTVLIVEFRDLVFNRLAAHFERAGIRVVRARCGFEAMVQFKMIRPQIVVANVHTPGQTGWLLAAKIRLVEPAPHVWLYKPKRTASDLAMAKFVRAEELLEYGNDLDTLSDAVAGCLAGESAATGTFKESWAAAS